jgi:hypothetical protein
MAGEQAGREQDKKKNATRTLSAVPNLTVFGWSQMPLLLHIRGLEQELSTRFPEVEIYRSLIILAFAFLLN